MRRIAVLAHHSPSVWARASATGSRVASDGSRGLADMAHAFPDVSIVLLFWLGALVIAFLPTLAAFGIALAVVHNLAEAVLAALIVLLVNAAWLRFSRVIPD